MEIKHKEGNVYEVYKEKSEQFASRNNLKEAIKGWVLNRLGTPILSAKWLYQKPHLLVALVDGTNRLFIIYQKLTTQ